MEHGYDELELVHVIKPFRLVDAESYERVYWRSDGTALANGYYVVSWSPRVRHRTFDESAVFQGPFRDRGRALLTLERLRASRDALRIAYAAFAALAHEPRRGAAAK
jgi:hypothetical protein